MAIDAGAKAPHRHIALCADDFGLSPGISDAIATLAHAQRLSGVSCITNSRHWAPGAALLRGLPASVSVGLHFNLTEGRPLSAALARHWPELPALPRLILAAHARRLPLAALADEWHAQLDAFQQCHGRPPDLVDGHQHVHHLPGVRELVTRAVAAWPVPPAVRNTGRVTGPGFWLKRQLIEATGGRQLQRNLVQHGLRHNTQLLGVYDFRSLRYAELMRSWLREAPTHGGLVFCHPGPADVQAGQAGQVMQDTHDAIGTARAREFAYLLSTAFTDDLAEHAVTLGSAWAAPARA